MHSPFFVMHTPKRTDGSFFGSWRDHLYYFTKNAFCANMNITKNSKRKSKEGIFMLIEIDFNSDEAIYLQLRNQIIMGIATSTIHEGDPLPSVRTLAENIGINMHTVNKAYNVLRQEGFIQLDRRKGAVICIDVNKIQALQDMKEQLRILLAKGSCKGITREEVHELVDEIYEEYK